MHICHNYLINDLEKCINNKNFGWSSSIKIKSTTTSAGIAILVTNRGIIIPSTTGGNLVVGSNMTTQYINIEINGLEMTVYDNSGRNIIGSFLVLRGIWEIETISGTN